MVNLFDTSARTLPLEQQISKLQLELDTAQVRAQSLFQYGKNQAQAIEAYYASLFADNADKTKNCLATYPPQNVAGWNDDRWSEWNAAQAREEKIIRIGDMVDQQSNAFSVVGYAPFVGSNKAIIIRSGGSAIAQGLALLQSLVVRSALMLPHQSRYTLVDPAGHGLAFPMRRYLPQVRESSSDVRRDLDQVIADIQRIIETYLDASITSFERVPHDMRVNERFQFVFVADFPNQYDRRAIEALQSISNTGAAAGVYLFIQHNTNYELPHDMSMDGFKNACYIDVVDTQANLRFVPDAAPPPEVQSRLFEALRLAKPPERTLDWDSIVGIDEAQWWQDNSSQIIETPIGLRGGGESMRMWFGVNGENPCAHGMLGAMTGSGKSNLYHVLISGLASRYSPKDLRLYLVDGKDGVEFQAYRHLPHAEVVSLHSSAELSRSVLAELIEEKERRNTLFARSGVADLTAYHRKGQPLGNLPRVLLLIDEYQELFDGDREGVASNYLLQLAQQGRSAGIHMLLASQRFGAQGMLNQPAIFGNLHLRMAMHMTDSDVQALTEFGRRGKALVLTCDLPGKIVLNDKSGDDNANQVGKVAYLRSERRNQLLQTLSAKARTLPKAVLPQTVVFDGQAQPALLDNTQFTTLLYARTWPTAQQLEDFARKPRQAGGFDIVDWFAAEHPRIAWLGQEFNVRGQARLLFRRRTSENAIILGGSNAARYGMLAATLASLAVNANPAETQFIVVDRCIPGTQWSDILAKTCNSVLTPAGFSTYYTNNGNIIEDVFNDVLLELQQRQMLGEEKLIQLPSIFVTMTELDRVEKLRRKADAFGLADSPLSEKLRILLTEGPALGIHMILSFSGIRPMISAIDERQGLINFRHRIALQMGEDESFTFVRSRKAAQLQLEGAIPVCALYMDMESDKAVRFKPYSTDPGASPPEDSLTEQLPVLGKYLAGRKQLR